MVDQPGRGLEVVAAQLRAQSLGRVARDVSLAELSAWRVGGRADLVFWPEGEANLISGIAALRQNGIKVTIVGMTTNLLFADEGLRGALVVVAEGLSGIAARGACLRVGAGVWTPHVALAAMRHGLTGVEHICGIPGTFGGLVSMNGGSLRRSISENINSVRIWSGNGPIVELSVDECDFAYRASRFQNGRDLIMSADVVLERGARATIRRTMLNILSARRRFPRKIPNCGSVFVSEPTMYREWGSPGALIERAGLKGTRMGGAIIAPQHANFILNTGGAAASDILGLIGLARQKIWETTGEWLRTEVHYVSEAGNIVPAANGATPA